MKFLCVPCDQPMKLSESRGPDEGSISLVYSCSACGYENEEGSLACGLCHRKLSGQVRTRASREAASGRRPRSMSPGSARAGATGALALMTSQLGCMCLDSGARSTTGSARGQRLRGVRRAQRSQEVAPPSATARVEGSRAGPRAPPRDGPRRIR